MPPAGLFNAYTAPLVTASAYTAALNPEPKADQLLPFHLATFVEALPPELVRAPPTYRSLPDAASEVTGPCTPDASADQSIPSHLAMLAAATPSTIVK